MKSNQSVGQIQRQQCQGISRWWMPPGQSAQGHQSWFSLWSPKDAWPKACNPASETVHTLLQFFPSYQGQKKKWKKVEGVGSRGSRSFLATGVQSLPGPREPQSGRRSLPSMYKTLVNSQHLKNKTSSYWHLFFIEIDTRVIIKGINTAMWMKNLQKCIPSHQKFLLLVAPPK